VKEGELWLIEINKTKDESRKSDAYNAERIKEYGFIILRAKRRNKILE
jgi:hypothetical protein